MEFSYLFRALWRRKWILLICVVASSLLAFVFTRNGKKEYQSSAQIATRFTVSDQPNGSVNYIQSEFEFGNVIEMITSPNVVSLLSYHLLMHDLQSPEPFTTLNARQQQLAGTIDKNAIVLQLSTHLDSVSALSTQSEQDRTIMNLLNVYGYSPDALAGSIKA